MALVKGPHFRDQVKELFDRIQATVNPKCEKILKELPSNENGARTALFDLDEMLHDCADIFGTYLDRNP